MPVRDMTGKPFPKGHPFEKTCIIFGGKRPDASKLEAGKTTRPGNHNLAQAPRPTGPDQTYGKSGEGPEIADIFFEVAPDPNDIALAEAWDALDSATKLEISQNVADHMVPKVLQEMGTKGRISMQLGGYLGTTRPLMRLHISHVDKLLDTAKLLGYVLSQDFMMVVGESEFAGGKKTGAVKIDLPSGWGEQEITAFYDTLWGLEEKGEKRVVGYTVVDGRMTILNRSALSTEVLAADITAHIKANGYLGAGLTIHTDTVYSAFPQKQDYGYGNNHQDHPQGTPLPKGHPLKGGQIFFGVKKPPRSPEKHPASGKPDEAEPEKPDTPVEKP